MTSLCALQERPVSSVYHVSLPTLGPLGILALTFLLLLLFVVLEFSYGHQHKSNRLTEINSTNIFFNTNYMYDMWERCVSEKEPMFKRTSKPKRVWA